MFICKYIYIHIIENNQNCKTKNSGLGQTSSTKIKLKQTTKTW